MAQVMILRRMGEKMQDQVYVEKCNAWLQAGAKALEEKLWSGQFYLNFNEPETQTKSDLLFGYQLGGEWITDWHGLPGVFPKDRVETTLAMIEIIRAGGFSTGGFNFDAKVRRQSIDAADLFHGHIGGIDTIARALLRAEAIVADGQLESFRKARYAGWQGELGKLVHAPATTLVDVAEHAIQPNHAPEPKSGRQEWCENLVNRF